jgi:hypothetical protein
MQKQALTVGNINYAAYRDNDNFVNPIEPVEEFILLRSGLVASTLKIITLTDFTIPIQLRSLYYFSSTTTTNKNIELKIKDNAGNAIFKTIITINFVNVILPQIILQPTFTIELMATTHVESLSLLCKKIGFVDIRDK